MKFLPTDIYLKNGLTDGVGIDVILPASSLNQYNNME